MRTESVRQSVSRAVNLGQVQEGSDSVDLLPRARDTRTGIVRGPHECLGSHLARVARVRQDIVELARTTRSKVHVVVDELAPDVAEIGQAIRIDGLQVVTGIAWVILVVDDVADDAGAGIEG